MTHRTPSRVAHVLDLQQRAEHARLSHRHWVLNARQGGSGSYGPAYCLEGAATWRRILAETLAALRGLRADLVAA
jgi:hypothetical protein